MCPNSFIPCSINWTIWTSEGMDEYSWYLIWILPTTGRLVFGVVTIQDGCLATYIANHFWWYLSNGWRYWADIWYECRQDTLWTYSKSIKLYLLSWWNCRKQGHKDEGHCPLTIYRSYCVVPRSWGRRSLPHDHL